MKINNYLLLLCIYISFSSLHPRSIHRRADPLIPEICVSWNHPYAKKFCLQSYHLEEYPYFKIFNQSYLNNFSLPDESIINRNSTLTTNGSDIKAAIDTTIKELKSGRKKLSLFTTLKDCDFNYKCKHGMVVLRYKHGPYIVKLFIESPKSLVEPYNKGIEPCFFFICGGGINRHLTGMTRIGNRELVKEKLNSLPQWKNRVDLPRKWFYIPTHSRWITIHGKNIGTKPHNSTEIPEIYAIIADEIKPEREFSILSAHDRAIALELSNDLDTLIDAHINNFMIEKGTGKIIIIDTEHFPSLVGLDEKGSFTSYGHWYCSLAGHYIQRLCRTKRQRRLDQKRNDRYYLSYKVSSDSR